MKNQKLYAAILAAIFAIGVNQVIANYWSPSSSNNTSTSLFSSAKKPVKKSNTIQVALLLDTSGSMDGLIEQAKSQLWQILNLLAKTERQQEETALEIALYEYGNSRRTSRGKQIRRISGFTKDMDRISEKLFALTTSGGDEYCGEVIMTSVEDLDWAADDSNMKMIYIAGNEPFTQGPINYAKACQLAKKQNISVNTIFCGVCEEGIQSLWKQGADLAGGEYLCINQNEVTTYIETPYDDEINDLNEKLNETYIPYGEKGKKKQATQRKQDTNARTYSKANAADRAAFKSSKKYKAEEWDLVDAYEKDKGVLKKTWEEKNLADTTQTITIEELEKKVEEAAAE
ncbi:MAG: vWA domain-containing protein, partial [Bacteroidota bacterium]